MTAEALRKKILRILDDVAFSYNGSPACIVPYNENHFDMGYKNTVSSYSDINDLMSDPVFDGKSLNEIAEYVVLR